jgi:nitrate/TMAO reductase-like tetraheme cytochrome c subunit
MQKDVKNSTINASPKLRRIKFFSCVILGLILAVISFLILDKAMKPLSADSFCIKCHEMTDAHETWQASGHHTNASGVKVTCVSCHLPPREDYTSHLLEKGRVGIKDTWVHFFGKYDAAASVKHVLETMPNERCLSCHSNLEAITSSGAVGKVHRVAVETGRGGGYGCVVCHDALHGGKPHVPERKEYDQADNYYCYVCHINFDGEEFATAHKNANVGCADCHGDSEKHSADEDNVTPPDTMYKESDVNNSCMSEKCHSTEKLEKEIGHRPFLAKTDIQRKYCTDCHGNHKISERQRKWDKDSGKLIWRDGYQVQ